MKIPPLLAALLLAVCGDRAVAAETTRPNVLLLCVDDLKPLLGCYGEKLMRSPNIDRLARRGTLFERAYCNQAVCAPSRNSLLTGVRPTTLGIYDLGTNFREAVPNAVTLPQYFKQHGYRTEALGKIFHVGHGNHEDPASWSVPHFQQKSIAYVKAESRSHQGLTREEALFANQDARNLPRGAPWESADVPDNAYPDGKIADETIRRLQAAKANPTAPFFLAVGFLKPHLPFCAPKRYWDLYDRAAFTVPALRTAPVGAPRYAPSGWGELRQYSDIPETGPLTDAQAITMIHGYHAAVSYMDAQLGRVLDELDRLGLASNTLVVLWGDHGWHLGDHGWWCKHDNYEQATRIPLIVSAPGVTQPGTRATRALVETVDIYPTLAELAGLPAPDVPQRIEGRSFVPALRDPKLGTQDYVYHVYPRGERIGRAVRTTRHRLVEWKVPGRTADSADLELYDYEADSLETRNLAAEQPEVVSRMRALLARQPEAKVQITRAVPVEMLKPYAGPSVQGVDTSTLSNKVMCGYQGWFNAEGDGAERGWVHWTKRRGPLGPGNAKIDLWPDVSQLGADERFATGFTNANGRTLEVFSAYKQATVLRHFQWMRDYGIDGAFVQRFITDLRDSGALRHNNSVLAHCREGANRFGRAYVVMYDLSGLGTNRIQEVINDWRALRARMHVTEDPAYLRHRGRPLVAVWGVGFNDGRRYTLEECRRLVEFLKKDGCSVMLGVPTGFRQLTRDAVKDPALQEVIQLADVVSPWTVGRYRGTAEAKSHGEKTWQPDVAWCAERKLDFLPVVFPGFSWFNMFGRQFDAMPRMKGAFLWSQFVAAKRAGATMIYVAMFDEVDEGTAIFKCTNDAPVSDTNRFVTYEGLPSDFYLRLTGEGAKLLRGERPVTEAVPLP